MVPRERRNDAPTGAAEGGNRENEALSPLPQRINANAHGGWRPREAPLVALKVRDNSERLEHRS